MLDRASLRLLPLLLLLVSSLTHAGTADEGSWATHREEQGVRLEAKTGDGPGPRFRATAEFDAGIFEVMAVLADDGRRTEWMPRCIESRPLQVTPKSRVIYTRTEGNWPVSDRDAVVRSQVRISPDGDRAEIELEAIDWPGVPPIDGAVRMPELTGGYVLTSLGKDRTGVLYQVSVDLGGRVPGFVLDFVREQMPFDNLVALREQVITTRGTYGAEIATMRADLSKVSTAR